MLGVILIEIHVFGNIFFDVLSYGEKVHESDVITMPGGSGFNVAYGLTLIGYEVYLHSVYGNDELGDYIRNHIKKNTMSDKYINRSDGKTGIFVSHNDRPVSVRKGLNFNKKINYDDIDFKKCICVLMATEMSKNNRDTILSKKWFKTFVDIGPNCDNFINADFIIGNENECINKKCNIIKMGKNGARYDDLHLPGSGRELPYTIGAGDVFDCAIIDSFIREEDKHEMLKSAVDISQESCLIPGSSEKMKIFKSI